MYSLPDSKEQTEERRVDIEGRDLCNLPTDAKGLCSATQHT